MSDNNSSIVLSKLLSGLWFETPSTVEDHAHSVVNSICLLQ